MANGQNPILEYWRQISAGEIAVSQKVRRVYQKLAWDVEHPGEYFYSQKRAEHVITFIERYCRHSKGKLGGQPIRLELWQRAMLAAAFGFIDEDGIRKYREIIWIVGKKNGKSTLSAAIGNYMLFADGEAGPEIYAVATKKDQAKIIWEEARRMVRKSPALLRRARTLVAEIVNDANDGKFRALASDKDTLDGLNVFCALMDEIHQWKAGRGLYDIIADGVASREQPMIVITTTAGTIRQDIYDEKYEECERIIQGYDQPDGYHDERVLPIVYELDSRNEWQDPACWEKANPGLGTIKNRQTLTDKVERCKANPRLLKNVLCKEFNIRETSSEAWLTYEEIRNRATFRVPERGWTDEEIANGRHDPGLPIRPEWLGPEDAEITLRPRYAIGGVDLSGTTDLTAAKAIFQVPESDKIFVCSMYWLPEDVIERRVKEDKIPYDLWHEQGLLRLCPGNKINPHAVTEWFRELWERFDLFFYAIGYDEWGAEIWAEEMRQTFGRDTMIPVRQGVKTLSAPMKLLGADLAARRIVYNDNPIDEWCLMNTSYEEDRNGNIQPKKTNNPRRRIDGAAALLDAYTVFLQKEEAYRNLI